MGFRFVLWRGVFGVYGSVFEKGLDGEGGTATGDEENEGGGEEGFEKVGLASWLKEG